VKSAALQVIVTAGLVAKAGVKTVEAPVCGVKIEKLPLASANWKFCSSEQDPKVANTIAAMIILNVFFILKYLIY
jgi:hypothetical protein